MFTASAVAVVNATVFSKENSGAGKNEVVLGLIIKASVPKGPA